MRRYDPTSQIWILAAGEVTAAANIIYRSQPEHELASDRWPVRVGAVDTPWKYPNSDERLASNLEMFTMARQIAELHGRKPATAD